MTDELVSETNTPVVDHSADIFELLLTLLRLRIVLELRSGEKSVGDFLEVKHGKQPDMSQHLTMMCKAPLFAWRKRGAQVCCRIAIVGQF